MNPQTSQKLLNSPIPSFVEVAHQAVKAKPKTDIPFEQILCSSLQPIAIKNPLFETLSQFTFQINQRMLGGKPRGPNLKAILAFDIDPWSTVKNVAEGTVGELNYNSNNGNNTAISRNIRVNLRPSQPAINLKKPLGWS